LSSSVNDKINILNVVVLNFTNVVEQNVFKLLIITMRLTNGFSEIRDLEKPWN